MSRFVDKGAIVAAYVGIGMALVVGVSFLLVIPIEPVYWLLAPLSGLLIGYYANTRSERQAGPWSRILVNGTFAGLVTGLTMAALLLGVKALFFAADDGYRDASLGAPLTCQTGAPCVYARYLDQPGAAAKLESQGVTDVSSFTAFYWNQQFGTAETLLLITTAGGLGGAFLYGLVRPKPRSTAGSSLAPRQT
ncbi:MAG: hypothetical protein ACHQ3P_01815 [Candidatus Limnocylindrales bacterium]